ncbi:MAG: hypothetical protein Kow0063_41410 [Anaerolineae bacterium]
MQPARVASSAATTGGKRWTAVNEGLADLTVYALAIDPEIPSRLYAGTGRGLFTTADGGAHWTPGEAFTSTVHAVLLDARDPMTIYAGTDDGLYYSPDGGGVWELAGAATPVQDLAQDETGALYAATGKGLYRYATPAEAGEQLRFGDVRALFIDPEPPGTIYLGTPGGAVFSADKGQSWQDAGLSGIPVRGLHHIPATRTLYALTEKGLFRAALPQPPPGARAST